MARSVIAAAAQPALLRLNNAHASELSLLRATDLARLLDNSFHAARIGEADALLIAFDESADYDSPNFLWFRGRFHRFVYVDRIVVDPAARGRGYALRLYAGLFEAARGAGHTLVACEVNKNPPNPASDAFHARLGFEEVGTATVGADGKQVRYLTADISRSG